MITDSQLRFLEGLLSGTIRKSDDAKKFSATMIRIQQQIDRNLTKAKWLVDNYIEILTDEKAEIDNEKLERYRRFRTFLYIINKLNPLSEVEDVELKDILKRLSQLYPDNYFEVTKKGYEHK